MRNRLPSVVMIALVVGGSVARPLPVSASNDLRVDSREYKLMLEASRFRGSTPLSVIDEMWNGSVMPLIQGLNGIEADPDSPLRVVYSKSTRQPIGRKKKINTMADPLELFLGFEAGLTEEAAAVDRKQELEMVSNLDIRERVYGGRISPHPRRHPLCISIATSAHN